VYQQQLQQEQQQQEQEQQDAENPFLDPPFSRIKTKGQNVPRTEHKISFSCSHSGRRATNRSLVLSKSFSKSLTPLAGAKFLLAKHEY
jgi:hypothetical protein